mmetsp:Transcript_36829/g.80492  ORF Transcript_36829/g.80492 Transcript_36829/m.80492 type:complete len:139 (+) Transcript_36829:39-455(+)
MADPEVTPLANVEVTEIEITPNECPIGNELFLAMSFTLDQPLAAARWKIKYIVDSAAQRQILELGETETTDYGAGPQNMAFSVPSIDVAGIPKEVLANAGLFVASLLSGSEEVMDVNMVTQVGPRDGELVRTIFNPLF